MHYLYLERLVAQFPLYQERATVFLGLESHGDELRCSLCLGVTKVWAVDKYTCI
jgi:hypothetical protein